MKIQSSIIPEYNSVILKTFNSEYLKTLYETTDIERFVKNLNEFYIVECQKTGFRYFYPSQLEGDSKFYVDLATFGKETDYYPSWRWAHSIAESIINPNDNVLEIGSGGLGFISRISKNGIRIKGLEISPYGVEKAKQIGVEVLAETIQEHSKNNKNTYDYVCFFEVLEHVYDIRSFIQSAIDSTKPGGKIVFSVPNNSSYIKNEILALNFPPHHMGLWDENSIKKLADVFNIKFVKYYFEPLPKSHVNWYLFSKEKKLLKIKPIGSIFYRSGFRKLTKKILEIFHTSLKGQTIVAVFEKQ